MILHPSYRLKLPLRVIQLVIASIVSINSPLFSEEQKEKTEIEIFESRSGMVLIKGYTIIGEMTGKYDSRAEVVVKELTNASTGDKKFGISIEIVEGGRNGASNTSFIDEPEIDSLLKGIEYISKIDKAATKQDNFEATYKTKDDLSITVFSTKDGKNALAVKSGKFHPAKLFLSISEFKKLQDLFAAAKSRIISDRK